MADNDLRGESWKVLPSRYLSSRPAAHTIPVPASRYLTMKDGCRIAADVYLPGDDRSGRYPAIFIQTPYYRRFATEPGVQNVEVAPNVAKFRDMFVPRGYALVVIDVRGTGASFGTRDSFRSPRERDDAVEIADWIVSHPWSNGKIGATGISYLGAASDFLASTGHPAVKAIAPLFSVWDTYLDNYYPGGVLLNNLAEVYDRLMRALDQDERPLLKQFVYYSDPNFRGPQPVDEDRDGALCKAAVAEHAKNFRMPDFMRELAFRNEPMAQNPKLSSATISPSTYAAGVRSDVAVYSVSGWMDGAGYANGAISRFLTLPNKHKYLLLGPWDHGARINVSHWRTNETPEFSILAEVLRFFDEFLMEKSTGLRDEQPIHYFSMHDERWHAASNWPPLPAPTPMFLNERKLSTHDGATGTDEYTIDFSSGTGQFTRYERIAAIDAREYYTDWNGRDRLMLNFDSPAVAADVEFSGHGTASLWVSSSEPDFAIHAYISELLPNGQTLYVTEGLLRALHRKETEMPKHYQATWPFHSCTREDASPVPVNSPELMQFSFLPVSWTFRRGSKIRLSIAGADKDHCERIPERGTPRLKIHRGGDRASRISLPLKDCEWEKQ